MRQVEQVLTQVEAGEMDEARGAATLVERVNRELVVWGHAGHEAALERVKPFCGYPRLRR